MTRAFCPTHVIGVGRNVYIMDILGTFQLGFIYSLLALGIFISFRVMNTPDLTADGSFTLGLAVSAMLTIAGHPFLGLVLGMLCGAGAGIITGFLQTKAGIQPILAGILTMTGLYSVNLFIMAGSPNLSLLGKDSVFSLAQQGMPAEKGVASLIVILLFCAAGVAVLTWFFKTGAGLRIRATGNNEAMVRASSINASVTRTAAIAVSNAFIALSGALLAQYQGYADINSGTGIIVVGLASVIIGEALFRRRSLFVGLVSAAVGAVIYRLLIALALYLDFFPAYMLKLVSAVIVAATLAIPKIQQTYRQYQIRKRGERDVEHNECS